MHLPPRLHSTEFAALPGSARHRIVVIKVGGSVFTGAAAYRHVADVLARRLARNPFDRLIVVVSAELGMTDALLSTAREFAPVPDPGALDVLWSTGELRSAALLCLSLHAAGVSATAANVHQAGLVETASAGRPRLRALRLHALSAQHAVVVAPGFLAKAAGDAVVSLGRGGSDLTAVLLAAGLRASRCELLKDVDGYFSSDPNTDPSATHLPHVSFDTALAMAANGCELVQRQALEAAREAGLTLVVGGLDGRRSTTVSTH